MSMPLSPVYLYLYFKLLSITSDMNLFWFVSVYMRKASCLNHKFTFQVWLASRELKVLILCVANKCMLIMFTS